MDTIPHHKLGITADSAQSLLARLMMETSDLNGPVSDRELLFFRLGLKVGERVHRIRHPGEELFQNVLIGKQLCQLKQP